MSDVSVIYGTDVPDMVAKLIERHDPFRNLSSNAKVVIKPNIVVSRSRWKGNNTDPAVVEQIIIHLKEKGIHNITVGDGSGMGNSATRAFDICGYREIAAKHTVALVDLEKDSFVQKKPPMKGPFSKLEIARTVAECDFLINVPVMKAHSQTKVTCSLKNLKGVMPRQLKTAFHGRDLDAAIAQLNSVVHPDFILVDGTYGDLRSEIGSDPVEIGMMLAGTDGAAVDRVAAGSLGFQTEDIRHVALTLRYRKIDPALISTHYLNKPSRERSLTVDVDYSKRYPCSITAEGVCCTCLSNLLFALERLDKLGKLKKGHHFVIGQKGATTFSSEEVIIAAGKCATGRVKADISVDGCPVIAGDLVQAL